MNRGDVGISNGLNEDDGFHSRAISDIMESRRLRIDQYGQVLKEGINACS